MFNLIVNRGRMNKKIFVSLYLITTASNWCAKFKVIESFHEIAHAYMLIVQRFNEIFFEMIKLRVAHVTFK